MHCTNCGANNPPEAAFCQKCGKKLDTTSLDDATVMTAPPAPSSSFSKGATGNSQFQTPEPISDPPPPLRQTSGEKEVISSAPQLPPYASAPKRRRGCLIALALIALIILAVVGAFAFMNRSTPNDTLTAYCSALKAGDYQTAYNQLSSGAKSGISEARFAQFWRQQVGAIKAWTVNSVQEQGSSATAAVSFTLSNGRTAPATIILIDESDGWKVASVTIGQG